MTNTAKRETKRVPTIKLWIELPIKHSALLKKLADNEHRSAKAQAEVIVMRSLESAEVQEIAKANG